MNVISVDLKTNGYKIVIGKGVLLRLGILLSQILPQRDAVVITTANVARLYGARLTNGLKKNGFSVKVLIVPDGEKSKSIQQSTRLLEAIARYDTKKNIFIVAFGGGVIGDLAGYVASIYKRGIPFIQVPTTFLAQIDSSVGGKVGIDLTVGKNLVGSFYQPKVVISDIGLLSTLPLRQMRNGFAEAVKYGIIADRKLFSYLMSNYKRVLRANGPCLTRVVADGCRIKRDVVVADEKETKGIRTILNFGHTVGHAIEAAGKFRRYQHGEAIALGMRVACAISRRLGMLKISDETAINNLLTNIGLPAKISGLKINSILAHMKHDKKFVATKNRFVLIKGIGKVAVVANVPAETIKSSINEYL